MGLSSTATVHNYLNRLEKKGVLRRGSSMTRAISVNAKPGVVSVPVLGRIAAGSPILAVENREDVITLSANVTGSGELFALRVRGNSMVGAGIFDGDVVVVRRQPTAEDGDMWWR